MTGERLQEIEQAARKYGSANCWTGITGTLAGMVVELLAEWKTATENLHEEREQAQHVYAQLGRIALEMAGLRLKMQEFSER